MIKIYIANDKQSFSLSYNSEVSENIKINNVDGQTIWMSQGELRELKYLITDILQHINKNDYE